MIFSCLETKHVILFGTKIIKSYQQRFDAYVNVPLRPDQWRFDFFSSSPSVPQSTGWGSSAGTYRAQTAAGSGRGELEEPVRRLETGSRLVSSHLESIVHNTIVWLKGWNKRNGIFGYQRCTYKVNVHKMIILCKYMKQMII